MVGQGTTIFNNFKLLEGDMLSKFIRGKVLIDIDNSPEITYRNYTAAL